MNRPVSSGVQRELFIPNPRERERGWISINDEVCVIEIEGDKVSLRWGFICSSNPPQGALDGSHVGVDNIKKTVVWGNEPFNRNADSADDAHERTFNVQDPLLFKKGELDVLADKQRAQMWFGDQYPEPLIDRIVAVVKELGPIPIP